jgi:hypothetical protein
MKYRPKLCLIDENGVHTPALARVPGHIKIAGLMFTVLVFEGVREAWDAGGLLSLEMLMPTLKSAAAAAIPVVWAYLSRSGKHDQEVRAAEARIAELERAISERAKE